MVTNLSRTIKCESAAAHAGRREFVLYYARWIVTARRLAAAGPRQVAGADDAAANHAADDASSEHASSEHASSEHASSEHATGDHASGDHATGFGNFVAHDGLGAEVGAGRRRGGLQGVQAPARGVKRGSRGGKRG
eukprot:1191701-Prorocentrum_minimum.AAC.1